MERRKDTEKEKWKRKMKKGKDELKNIRKGNKRKNIEEEEKWRIRSYF